MFVIFQFLRPFAHKSSGRICTKFGTHNNRDRWRNHSPATVFGDRLRGVNSAGGQNLLFPIDNQVAVIAQPMLVTK